MHKYYIWIRGTVVTRAPSVQHMVVLTRGYTPAPGGPFTLGPVLLLCDDVSLLTRHLPVRFTSIAPK